MNTIRSLTREDLLPVEEYEKVRRQRRANILDIKRRRRVAIGPHATFYFESYDTMWYQVHEMLRIEGGGARQVDEEIEAYAPLVPAGQELVATLMFEIKDAVQRDRELRKLGGVEEAVFLSINGERIAAVPEGDTDRTNAAGKTSAVHFLRFPVSEQLASHFKQGGCEAILGIRHPEYAHMAALTEATRSELVGDLA